MIIDDIPPLDPDDPMVNAADQVGSEQFARTVATLLAVEGLNRTGLEHLLDRVRAQEWDGAVRDVRARVMALREPLARALAATYGKNEADMVQYYTDTGDMPPSAPDTINGIEHLDDYPPGSHGNVDRDGGGDGVRRTSVLVRLLGSMRGVSEPWTPAAMPIEGLLAATNTPRARPGQLCARPVTCTEGAAHTSPPVHRSRSGARPIAMAVAGTAEAALRAGSPWGMRPLA